MSSPYDYCQVWHVKGAFQDAQRTLIHYARKDRLSMFRVVSNAAETAHYVVAYQDFGHPHPNASKTYLGLSGIFTHDNE
jgi:hypothetical protein